LAGSLAMFMGGWIFSIVILVIFIATNTFTGPIRVFLLPLTIISLIAAIVESISIKDFDNLTVPAISILLGYFLF
jgi:dolichol kinase